MNHTRKTSNASSSKSGWQRARSAAQKDQRIHAILDAATTLLEQHGYDGVTLMMIAKQAGFTRSNLYRYFSSREEIFLALYRQDHRAWLHDLLKSLDAAGELELTDFVELWVSHLQKQPRLLSLLARLTGLIEPPVATSVLTPFQAEQAEQTATLTSLLEYAVPGLDETQWRTFLQTSQALVTGLAPLFQSHADGTFALQLEETLQHYLIGVDAVNGGRVGHRLHRRQRNQITIGKND